MENFIQEALVMKDFDHVNVLNLFGLCFSPEDGSPYVILPFMHNGDLLSYVCNERNSPRVVDLLWFAIEIAQGMEYLASQKFVHRDLAARNCMLDEKLHVKVADFGLSRDVYEKEYYRSVKKIVLPVKWMAPESLEKNIYNAKTDVWAFGVTFWELMTRGVTPYPGVNNSEVIAFLMSGHRLSKPDCCPDLIHRIMERCWSFDAKERPSFDELLEEMKSCITQLHDAEKKRQVSLQMKHEPRSYYNQ